MSQKAKLAVIILNWNGKEMMRRFLPSVVKYTCAPEVRVVVADNGSTDGSLSWLQSEYPGIDIVALDKNYGFAEGYNLAIARMEEPFVLLLNSDVEVTEGWWQPLLAFMEENPNAGAVQPKILSYNDRERFEHAGAAGGLIDKLGYPYCRGRVLSKVEEDRGQYDSPAPVEVAWASGAALLVRRDAYEQAGGLDKDFFAHMEEIDLCWRLRLAGYGIYAMTQSKVYHLGGGALPYGNPRKTYLNFRNNLLMLYKNLPLKDRKKILFRRRLADTLGFLFFLAKGQFADARAVVKAHGDFRKMRKNYTEAPDTNILKEMPGADKSIFFIR